MEIEKKRQQRGRTILRECRRQNALTAGKSDVHIPTIVWQVMC